MGPVWFSVCRFLSLLISRGCLVYDECFVPGSVIAEGRDGICGISVSLMVSYDCLGPLFVPILMFLLIVFFGASGFRLVLFWSRSR